MNGYIFLNAFKDKQNNTFYFMSPNYKMVLSFFSMGNTFIVNLSYNDEEGAFHTQFNIIFNCDEMILIINNYSDKGINDRLGAQSYKVEALPELKELEAAVMSKLDIWLKEKSVPADYIIDMENTILSELNTVK